MKSLLDLLDFKKSVLISTKINNFLVEPFLLRRSYKSNWISGQTLDSPQPCERVFREAARFIQELEKIALPSTSLSFMV